MMKEGKNRLIQSPVDLENNISRRRYQLPIKNKNPRFHDIQTALQLSNSRLHNSIISKLPLLFPNSKITKYAVFLYPRYIFSWPLLPYFQQCLNSSQQVLEQEGRNILKLRSSEASGSDHAQGGDETESER